MKNNFYSSFNVIKRDLEYFRNLTTSSTIELALKERLSLEQKIRELSESQMMKLSPNIVRDFESIKALTTNSAYELFLKESQMLEHLKEHISIMKSRQQLEQINHPWGKYQEITSAFNSLVEMRHLESKCDFIKQFSDKMFKAYEIEQTFSEHLASITKATEAMRINFAVINNAINSNDYLSSMVFRPSIELQAFIMKSDNLAKRRLNDSLQIDAINTSIELASSESIESTNLVISASDLIETEDEESHDLFESLPTFNLYSFQRKEILTFARHNPKVFQNPENIDSLPSYNYYRIAKSCCYLIIKGNEKAGALGEEYIFKPSNKLMTAIAALPDLIAHNISTFGEFIDYLYFLLYEGAGSDNLKVKNWLTDNELQSIWDIKAIRNFYLRHDVEHGDIKEAKRKMQKVGDIFHRLISKPLPENSHDYRKAQTKIISNVVGMLNLLYARIKTD